VPKGLSPWVRFVTYWGRGDVLEKIERLLSRHRFGRMRDILAAWEAGDGAASPGFRPPPRPL
jgi:hypothetical protein